MIRVTQLILLFFLFYNPTTVLGQDVELYQQFNGRYDYTAIGNTLNLAENGTGADCIISTESSATLSLNANQTIVAAYLYWAGSDTGDFNVSLNNNPVTAERTFSDALDANRLFFAAFADVTTLVQSIGSDEYTLSDLDIQSIISPYCPTGTNFAGWAITIIYEDDNLPLNQLNVYDGLQSVPDILTITLDNLNVLDNENAKIGFIAWEGDRSLAVNEKLTINGNIIGNPPLNPINNAFNGTNSFTGASDLYNMDIDVYNIQNNISIGDTSATIQLTSGQDFVMINNIITVLNSQLPDATISLDNYIVECGNRNIEIEYTVNNFNSTDVLPNNTPITFYANGIVVGQTTTLNTIEINESETNSIVLTIPETVGEDFILTLSVDDIGDNSGIVIEINENNNMFEQTINLLVAPPIETLPETLLCDEGFNSATFNLNEIFQQSTNINDNVAFYTSLSDLQNQENEIFDPTAYNNTTNPETIYARVESDPCYDSYQFNILVENCPPYIPDGFSPNNDGPNDWFNIQGLYDIFENHKLLIYNRYGTLIFEGDNSKPWDGKANRGINNLGKLLPVGTYYYVLHLNDPNYKSMAGWVYLNY
ncbi:gliding motility-associated C-terminal domain-containing protein [Meridianimaribacter sp. CL38]|uniref:T9SS type B sorting domain-containing protein n=1 Tax=Meridianimaribacter sp. CL38 TaxID=2213021 RepID=UPI00103D101B|nr:gliding motility-associated C-terminal domain-containing protein [Meridianimaribacter sp. CL38]TBV26289.1 gliding motility-associated C-terminal domain-containing protein [Meridianimaribacter sp. CL38]